MQGQRSAIGSLPETFGFNHGSTSSDGIDQQICWNSLGNPAQSRLPEYMVSSNETNIPYLSPANQERQNIVGWSLGESSSSAMQNNVSRSECKTHHGWSPAMSACPGPSHFSAEQQYGSSSILSLGDIEVNLNNRIANNTLFSQGSSSSTIPHDLNSNPGLEEHDVDAEDDDPEDDDCQVMECTSAHSDGPGKERMLSASTPSDPSAGPSGSNVYLMDESNGRPAGLLDGRRSSCKRKAREGHLGQPSGSGSSNYLPGTDNSLWHSLPAPHSMTTGANISAPSEISTGINLPEQVNPRLGLTIGGATPENSAVLPASGSAETYRRNFRLRFNGSHRHDSIPSNLFPAVGDVANVNASSDRHPSRLLHNNFLDLRSVPASDNGISHGLPSAHVPSLRRSAQTRWNSSSSRAGTSSSFSVFGERDSAAYEEQNSRSVPRSISQHPVFIPANDLRNLNQNPANWSLAGGNISIAGNVASSSRTGSSSGPPSSSPSWVQNRNPPQYSRRLSEYVRRSLVSSAGIETGGHSGNTPPIRLSSAASSEAGLSGNHGHRPSSSRSTMLLERHLDGAIGVPYSWRTLATASEGRSRLVSEIRNVLDRMRRGEGLRFEDVMILDQSGFFGMADIHDRHRDMRLDVDNMSYEELLALEERIGNVCTGLSEETISSRLKQRKFICQRIEPQDTEPCCVCQEEYKDGEDLGTLECGHDFHSDCIKKWLTQKNSCPICKTTGLSN